MKLTPRQRQIVISQQCQRVLLEYARGKTYTQIGERLGISAARVGQYIAKVARSIAPDATESYREILTPHLQHLLGGDWRTPEALRYLFPKPFTREEANAARAVWSKRGKAEGTPRPDACEMCRVPWEEYPAPQAHHTDYSKPLDVVWLCTKCHACVHFYARQEGHKAA